MGKVFGRDRADLGPAHAARRAADDVERYGPARPLDGALQQLRAAWTTEQDLRDALWRTGQRREVWVGASELGRPRLAQLDAEIAELTSKLHAASRQVSVGLHEPAVRALSPDRIEAEHAGWARDRREAHQSPGKRPNSNNVRTADLAEYRRSPDRGRGMGR